MSKNKIRQGQSRWIVWVYQDVQRQHDAELGQAPIVTPTTVQLAQAGGAKSYHLERVEVVNVIHGGRSVVVKMGDLSNKSTWPVEDFRKCPDTFRKARRQMLEAQARA